MDRFAMFIGYAVIETTLAAALVLWMIYAAVKWKWFARGVKIAFLVTWGAAVIGAPLAAVALARSGSEIPTYIGAIAFLTIGAISYRYLGLPELVRTLKRQDH